jgi:hypothetical protein
LGDVQLIWVRFAPQTQVRGIPSQALEFVGNDSFGAGFGTFALEITGVMLFHLRIDLSQEPVFVLGPAKTPTLAERRPSFLPGFHPAAFFQEFPRTVGVLPAYR